MASNAQIKANQFNARLGGVKSPEGKAISKYNAQKHGILRNSVTEYEHDFYISLLEDLEGEYKPMGVIERILLERIAVNYLKLFRVQKAETEFMKSKLNPRITRTEGGFSFVTDEDIIGKTVVIEEGYSPKIDETSVEILASVYGRYESTIENRLYRSINELEKVQKSRKTENVHNPAVVNQQLGSFGENGGKIE